MRNKKAVASEIIKLRKLLNSSRLTELEKDKVWCTMLGLQWVLTKDTAGIGPCDICVPGYKRLGLLRNKIVNLR